MSTGKRCSNNHRKRQQKEIERENKCPTITIKIKKINAVFVLLLLRFFSIPNAESNVLLNQPNNEQKKVKIFKNKYNYALRQRRRMRIPNENCQLIGFRRNQGASTSRAGPFDMVEFL